MLGNEADSVKRLLSPGLDAGSIAVLGRGTASTISRQFTSITSEVDNLRGLTPCRSPTGQNRGGSLRTSSFA